MKLCCPIKLLAIALISVSAILFTGCSSDSNEVNKPGPTNPREEDADPDCNIETFVIKAADNGFDGEDINFRIDQRRKTITATDLRWLGQDNPDMLAATFSHTGKKVIVEGADQQSGITSNSFKDQLTYTVVAENGDTKSYKVLLINPIVNREIPVIRILPERNIVDKVNYVQSDLTIIGNSVTEGLWDEPELSEQKVEVRLRGNSTMDLPKKPYRIKFPEKYSPLGLNHASAKSWTLLANDCDKTLLRNAVAFEFSRILFNGNDAIHGNTPVLFTPATLHVHLYVGDSYEGIYHMSDQIQRDAGRVNISSLKASHGSDPGRITGGYLLEVDIHANEYSEPYYFPSSKYIKVNPKYPEDDDFDPAQYAYIEDFMSQAETALWSGNFTSDENNWRNYWDEASAVDFFIVQELTGNPDGFTSIYLYKERGIDKFFFGPVWDFDKAYNNDNRRANLFNDLMVHRGFFTMDGSKPWNEPEVNWHGRMWEDPRFRRAVRDRWNNKKNELRLAASRILNDEPQRMEHSISANFTRWDVSEQALYDAMPAPATYEQGITTLKNYINVRFSYLDGLFNSEQ